MERLRQIRSFLDRFFLSTPFLLALLVSTIFVPIFERELEATIVYICLISLLLLLCDDILTVFFPVLLLCTFLTRCYDCYNRFFPYRFWLLPVVVALFLHFCLYRQKIRVGETFPGLCLVSIAVTLSVWRNGLGEIKWISLYYLLGLGFGLLAAYLLLRSQLKAEHPYDVKQKFAVIMTLMGVFVCVCIVVVYAKGWRYWKRGGFLSSNNLATLLLMAMPFPTMLSLKKKLWLPFLFLFFAGTVMSSSRGGALVGAVELLLCLFYLFFRDRKYRYYYLSSVAVFVVVGLIAFSYVARYVWDYAEFSSADSLWERVRMMYDHVKNDPRARFLSRMKTDFLSDPMFGRGLFYRGNEDLYHPKTGAMNWYHIWFAQVIGSMGIVGIVAYGYQLAERIVVAVRHGSAENRAFFLSYVGLFLMSQVNPGEFCPFPYAMLAVITFIFIEDGPLFRKTTKSAGNDGIATDDPNAVEESICGVLDHSTENTIRKNAK